MELCAVCIIGIKVGSKSIPPSQLSHFMKIDSAHNSKENAKKRENTPIIMHLSQMADPGPKCGYFGILSWNDVTFMPGMLYKKKRCMLLYTQT